MACTGRSLAQNANMFVLGQIHLYPEKQHDVGKEYVCTFEPDRPGFKFNTTNGGNFWVSHVTSLFHFFHVKYRIIFQEGCEDYE